MSPVRALVTVLSLGLAGPALAGPALALAGPALQAVKKPIRLAPAPTARLTAEQRSAVASALKTAVAAFGRDRNGPKLVSAGARLQGAARNAYRVQATAIASANAGNAQQVAARYGIDAAEVVAATNSGPCPAEISIEFTVDDIPNAGVHQFVWANGHGTLSSDPLGTEPPPGDGPLGDFPGGFPGLCGAGTWVCCPPGICVPGDTCGY